MEQVATGGACTGQWLVAGPPWTGPWLPATFPFGSLLHLKRSGVVPLCRLVDLGRPAPKNHRRWTA